MRHPNKQVVWLAVGLFAFLLLLDVLGFANSMMALENREGWVQHTQQVQNAIDALNQQIDTTNIAQRNFILTGDQAFLNEYTTALPVIAQDVQLLDQSTRDNSRQQQRLAVLRPLLATEQTSWQQTIAQRQAGDTSGADQASAHNMRNLQQIRATISDMLQTEQHLFAVRSNAVQGAMRELVLTFMLGLLALCVCGVGVGLVARAYLAQRERVAEEQTAQMEREHELRRQAELALSQRDQFFGLVAHELKNPIAAMRASSQLAQRMVQREPTQNARLTKLIASGVHQSQRLTQLVEGMLDSSRIAEGTFAVERAPLDLAALVLQVIEEVRPTTSVHTIQTELPAQPVIIDGDQVRLEQVCYNLLQNAVKYSPDGGQIEVRLAVEDDHAVLRVRDHGIGIPAAALPHLFERLYRAPNAERSAAKGMGVGLYVTHQIVTMHDGTIAVDSVEDDGTTFTVALPLAAVALASGMSQDGCHNDVPVTREA